MPAPIPDYSRVVLLLPMSGADNGTVFTDRSPTPKAMTRAGNTKTVTAQSKYYGSSVYFDGTDDYLRSDAVATAVAGSGTDFTVEGWFNPSVVGASGVLFAFNGASGNGNKLVVNTNGLFGSTFPVSSSFALSINVWQHIAVVRGVSSIRVYLNGLQRASITPTGPSNIVSGDTFSIGQEFDVGPIASDFYTGYMQDVCVTLGEKYTVDFTPPGRLIGEIAVTTKNEAGVLVPRKVFAVPRSQPSVVKATGTTDASGALTFSSLPACEYSVVAIADGDTLPDLVMRKQAA